MRPEVMNTEAGTVVEGVGGKAPSPVFLETSARLLPDKRREAFTNQNKLRIPVV